MLPVPREGDSPGSPVGGGGSGSATSEKANVRGKNLKEGPNITLRPAVLTSQHIYNLRNQGWSVPHPEYATADTGTAMKDPVALFHTVSGDFPSNADKVNAFIYPNTASNNDKDIERFNAKDCVNNPMGSSPAPLGSFIIDALERGTSRKSSVAQLNAQYSALTQYSVSDLPLDTTPGGASVVCEYSGRVFFSGFSGAITGGDKNSPRMSSYILFSQLVQDISNVNICYQSADPTNKDDSSLVDTDGGFIRLEGAYGINQMVNVGTGLMVFAINGVWMISGESGGGFSATSYKSNKLTNSGCISPGSVVVSGNTVLYWSQDGIYNIGPNQFGDYIADNISKKTIQSYYNEIDPQDAASCEGVYDSYENKIKWLYCNRTISAHPTRELILDLTLGSFYPYEISKLSGQRYPMAVKGVLTQPFNLNTNEDPVLVNGVQVTVGGVNVDVINDDAVTSVKEVKYLVITSIVPSIKYAFATYNVADHYDWKSIDGVGADAAGYMLTGVLSGGDFQRRKDVPHLTVHMEKTEDGYTTVNGDFQPTNQSSCLVQVQWEWSDSANSGRWTTPFQAYRVKRPWMVSDASAAYDDGYYVVSTKTRVRGSGKVLSILYSTEPGKHLILHGWSMKVSTNADV